MFSNLLQPRPLTLSRRERRYRTRIIQEWHLNKEFQLRLDREAERRGVSYKHLFKEYKRSDLTVDKVVYEMMRFAQAMSNISISCKLTAEGIDRFLKMQEEADK